MFKFYLIFLICSKVFFSPTQSIKINQPIQINWINKGEILVVDFGFSIERRVITTRILKVDVRNKKVFPFLNSDFKKPEKFYRISSGGKFIGVYDGDNDFIKIIQKNRIIYKHKLKKIMKSYVLKDVDKHSFYPLYNVGYPYFVNGRRIILILGYNDPDPLVQIQPTYLVDIDYKTGFPLNIIPLKRNLISHNYFPVYIASENYDPHFIILGNKLNLYDIKNAQLKRFSPPSIDLKNIVGPFFNETSKFYRDSLYFYSDKCLVAYNPFNKNIKKFKLSDKLSNVPFDSLIINSNYILIHWPNLNMAKISENNIIYRLKDKKQVAQNLLNKIKKRKLAVLALSPWDNKIFCYDYKNNKPVFFEIEEESDD